MFTGCTYLYPDPEHTETPEDHASFAGGQFDGFYKGSSINYKDIFIGLYIFCQHRASSDLSG